MLTVGGAERFPSSLGVRSAAVESVAAKSTIRPSVGGRVRLQDEWRIPGGAGEEDQGPQQKDQLGM